MKRQTIWVLLGFVFISALIASIYTNHPTEPTPKSLETVDTESSIQSPGHKTNSTVNLTSDRQLSKPLSSDKTPHRENTENKAQDMSSYQNLIKKNPIEAYKLLTQEPTENLWNRWVYLLDSTEASDIDEKSVLAKALIHNLQNADNDAFYQKAEVLLYESESKKNKSMIINLLQDIATPNALNVLLNAASANYNPEIESDLIRAIYHIGGSRRDRRFPTELSPQLENAWFTVSHDEYLFKAVTDSIAKIGAPSGLKLLIESLDNEILSPGQALVVENSMALVKNRRNISYLGTNIKNNYDANDVKVRASGTALAAMASIDATKIGSSGLFGVVF